MKNNAIILLAVLTVVGCNKDDSEAVEEVSSAREIVAPPGKELKEQGYNDEYVKVENTEKPNYSKYRKEWKRTNSSPTEGYRLVDGKITEISLDRMSFKDAFNMQYRANGEGHKFWWRGKEYITNVRKESDESK